MRVLVACEESQIVCSAFRNRGYDAYSCDLQDCSGGHPEWHIKDDVLNHLDEDWDLIIAHPPCTFMCKGSAVRMFPHGVINPLRYEAALVARDFFFQFLNCNCDFVAVENPEPLKVVDLPTPSQIIQPYMFGDPFSKKTCFWLKNLPQLLPNVFFCNSYSNWVGNSRYKGVAAHRSLERSKSFPGIASAMASQWGDYVYSFKFGTPDYYSH